MLLVSANLQAGPRRFGTPQEYAYGSSIDMQAGIAGMPFSYSGELRNAIGMSGGGEFQLRYTTSRAATGVPSHPGPTTADCRTRDLSSRS